MKQHQHKHLKLSETVLKGRETAASLTPVSQTGLTTQQQHTGSEEEQEVGEAGGGGGRSRVCGSIRMEQKFFLSVPVADSFQLERKEKRVVQRADSKSHDVTTTEEGLKGPRTDSKSGVRIALNQGWIFFWERFSLEI